MKFLSTLSIVLLGSFSISSALAKQCITSWELKSSGFTVGTTKEVLNIKDDGSLKLTSDFTPNAALKIFGLDTVRRSVILNPQQSLISRQETIGSGEETKKASWKFLKEQTYNRIVKDETVETIKVESGKKIIDSTIFPYMFYLGMLNSPQMNVKVFGFDSAYDAAIVLNATEKTRIDFTGVKSKGYVIVNEDRYPQYFSFTKDGKTVEGIQNGWQCN